MPTGIYPRKRRVQHVTIKCEVCAAEREVMPSYAERVSGKTCSTACAGVLASKQVKFSCATCGKECVRRRDKIKEQTYCSYECSSAGRRKEYAKWRDPEQIKQYMKEYGEKNRERLNELSRLRSPNYREKKNENQRKRRSLGERPRAMNRESWATILDVFGDKCLACGSTDRLEADHVIPVAKGGDNDPLNFQPLCRTCNASKGAAHIDYRTSTQVDKLKRAIVHAMHPAVKIIEV